MFFERKHEWNPHQLWPWQSVVSITGERLTGAVMRRKINGPWQYRAENEAEELESMKLSAP